MNEFTDEERGLLLRFLSERSWRLDRMMWYTAYILPSVLFAAYSLLRRDFVAALVAYIAILIVALMYLSYNSKDAELFRSAMEKYEARVGALKMLR